MQTNNLRIPSKAAIFPEVIAVLGSFREGPYSSNNVQLAG